eukprot:TRINITY_DN12054_c0_g1_i2.p1 TRINITY_DN12054_c0_g1~~TRINITY_DN12054_c0_g1_i2.p1  ORF type:complete len:831 (+),score=95.72 TRINITY_DN12054_c0_g1_i2:53-2545(+)
MEMPLRSTGPHMSVVRDLSTQFSAKRREVRSLLGEGRKSMLLHILHLEDANDKFSALESFVNHGVDAPCGAAQGDKCTTAFCDFEFQHKPNLWSGRRELNAKTCHLCMKPHCSVCRSHTSDLGSLALPQRQINSLKVKLCHSCMRFVNEACLLPSPAQVTLLCSYHVVKHALDSMAHDDNNQEVHKEILQQEEQKLKQIQQGNGCFGQNALLTHRIIEFSKNGLQAQKRRKKEARLALQVALHRSSSSFLGAATGDYAAKAVHVRRRSDTGFLSYWHHGVLCYSETVLGARQNQFVIHYWHRGYVTSGSGSMVQCTTLSEFLSGMELEEVHHDEEDVHATYLRAVHALGEQHYNAVFNNCEHFASWCATGRRTSSQIVQLAGYAGIATVAVPDTFWLASEVRSWFQLAAGHVTRLDRGGAFGGFAGWTRACGSLACCAQAFVEIRCALSDTGLNRTERQARILAALSIIPLALMFCASSISCTVPVCLLSFLLCCADQRYELRRQFGRWLLWCFPALVDACEEIFSDLRGWLMGTSGEDAERYQEALQSAPDFLQLRIRTQYDAKDVLHAYRRVALRYHPDKRGGDAGLFHKAQYAKLLLLEHLSNGQTWSGWLYACHFLDIPVPSSPDVSSAMLNDMQTSEGEGSAVILEKHKVRVAQGTEYKQSLATNGTLFCTMQAWLEQPLPCSYLQVRIWNATEGNDDPDDSSLLREFHLHFFSHTQREPLQICISIPEGCTHVLISARCLYWCSSLLDGFVSGIGSSTFSYIVSESSSPALPSGWTMLQQDWKTLQSPWRSRPWFRGVSEQRCALVIYDVLGPGSLLSVVCREP